ncbi:MAG: efflux RND transporter periplasmic adaptor subunit [Pirellulaceae bacterium]
MARRILPILMVVAVLGLLGALAYSQLRHEPLVVSGVIEADEIRLGSRVGGRVAEVAEGIDDGSKVSAGDLLVRLEPFDLRQRRDQAAATLAERQADLKSLQLTLPLEAAQAEAVVNRLAARLKELENGPRQQEIKAAEAQVTLAEAQLVRAQRNYERIAKLFAAEKGAATRDAMDRVTEELRVAEATKRVREQEYALLQEGTREEELDQAKASLAEAQSALEAIEQTKEEELSRARAAVDAAQASLAATETQLAELDVTAPVDGVVESIELQPGDLVAAGAPVISMIDTHSLWVRAYVPENHLDIKLNQQLAVRVDSYPGRTFQGRVVFVSRQGEFTPSNAQTPEERSKQVFRIKVQLEPGQGELRPGMAADVILQP